MLTVDELREEVEAGSIDTVVAALPDMQGRLMGKRFHARFFVDDVCSREYEQWRENYSKHDSADQDGIDKSLEVAPVFHGGKHNHEHEERIRELVQQVHTFERRT